MHACVWGSSSSVTERCFVKTAGTAQRIRIRDIVVVLVRDA